MRQGFFKKHLTESQFLLFIRIRLSQIKIYCQNHFRFQRKGFIYTYVSKSSCRSSTSIQIFQFIFFSKKKTFRNRMHNLSITEVTFLKRFIWLLSIRFYFHLCIFFIKHSELIPNIEVKINQIDLIFMLTSTAEPNSAFFAKFFFQYQRRFF